MSIYAYFQEGPIHERVCSRHHYETEYEMIIMCISTHKRPMKKEFNEKSL